MKTKRTIGFNGYVYIVDSAGDMNISGEENIYPREIEDVIFRHLELEILGG